MTNRRSLRELFGVWMVGSLGEILAYSVIEDGAAFLTVPVAAGGFVFFVTPLFLVAYSLIWVWPLAAMGDRAAASSLMMFAVVVEAISAWFWMAAETITMTTVVMRLLAVLTPVACGACAASAAWVYRRRIERPRRPNV